MLIGHHDDADDLPRNQQDTALIGDPRNDENTFVSQLQLTMLKFHNRVVDLVKSGDVPRLGSENDFQTAQRTVRWHYQWMVVHDFLRRIVGSDTLDAVFDESGPYPRIHRHFYTWRHDPYMPVGFSVAAYRFGHSQIRPAYQLTYFGGFRILPRFWTIEWPRFFEVDGAGSDGLQHSRLIDARLADPLADLPEEIANAPTSLIARNLIRGVRLLLPSGPRRRAPHGRRGAQRQRPGPAGRWRGAAVVLHPQRGRGPKRRHPFGHGRRTHRRRGVRRAARAGPVIILAHQPDWLPFLSESMDADFAMPDLIMASGHGLEPITPPGAPT